MMWFKSGELDLDYYHNIQLFNRSSDINHMSNNARVLLIAADPKLSYNPDFCIKWNIIALFLTKCLAWKIVLLPGLPSAAISKI